MKITRANPKEAIALTELTMRSKDHWNYGAKQIEDWSIELTITEDYIKSNQVYTLTDNDDLIGFYAFRAHKDTNIKLNYLFVDPKFIGRGYGNALMNDFFNRIQKLEYRKITLDSDPNAEKFYENHGFKTVGKLQSSIKNRYLPIMEKRNEKLTEIKTK